MKANDIIVQLAILWGMTIGSALSPKEIKDANEMKRCDSEEVFAVLSLWGNEYKNEEDITDFFNKKLECLLQA